MKKLTENVYVETQWTSGTQASGGSNSSFIVTAEGIILIDAPLVPSNAVNWREMVCQKGKILYLINTEFHADHTLGNYFFPVPIIAHEETRRSIPEALGTPDDVRRKVQENYSHCTDLVKNYQIGLPTITFLDRLNLYMGQHHLELLHLPGHTPGQIAVYVPRERVVFTGDNFSNGFQPALSYCCPLEWLDSLKRILDLDADYIVPGHGEVGEKRTVRDFMSFFQHCVDEVQEAIHRGMSKEQTIESIQFEDRLPPRHPGREQQRKNIGRLYDMLSKA
ncbi:MAG: MBL fold metallo-hydrolase [Thermodesulfobacteriota bacterium]|nr:MBL fold metallo-hydrolase [Thermodesulfobacteriota bacterium]